tara:strand:- start:239 stop:850 length:612 start_codon:yes stop_codon:yes gene_type:complete
MANVNVNPPLQKISHLKIPDDIPESLKTFIADLLVGMEEKETVVRQLRERTGGGSDTINNIVEELGDTIQDSTGQLHNKINSLANLIEEPIRRPVIQDVFEEVVQHNVTVIEELDQRPPREWVARSISTNYQAIDREYVEVSSGATVTLTPQHNAIIKVANNDGSNIKVRGAIKVGGNQTEVDWSTQDKSLTFHWFDDHWRIG